METTTGQPNRNRHDLIMRTVAVVGAVIAACALVLTSCQIWTIRDNAERQLRAYVSVSSKEIENFGEGKKARAQGILENLGQTPVYEAAWVSGINVLQPNGTFEYSDCAVILKEPKKWSFGKFGYPEKNRDSAFTKDEIDRVQANRANIYFHGRICYKDIFKKVRHSDFCVFWAWKDGHLGNALYCDQGNDAD